MDTALSRSVWADSRWLILAPHPDDETLGAGALIANAARQGLLAGVVYLTDGRGSHPSGTAGIAVARQREAGHALRRLTGRDVPMDWIGWPDAHPLDAGSIAFMRDAQWLACVLRTRQVDTLAVTGGYETHCDHVAAYRLALAARRMARRNVALFTYDVWNNGTTTRGRSIRTQAMAEGQRRHALRAHRSQLSNVYGAGFRLSSDKQRMPPCDRLLLHGRHS